jgi:hypothetical protein
LASQVADTINDIIGHWKRAQVIAADVATGSEAKEIVATLDIAGEA